MQARITKIRFGMLSPEEIRRLAVVEVQFPTIYNHSLPKVGGIQDHRMGTCDRRYACGTCGNSVEKCNGHFGCVTLPFPVYHVFFLDLLVKVLRCFCFWCSSLMTSKNDPKITSCEDQLGRNKFQTIALQLKNRRKCPTCAGIQPAYTRHGLSIKADWQEVLEKLSEQERETVSKPFTALTALQILKDVQPEDARALGFNPDQARLSDMILEVLPIPPPIIRPSISVSDGSRARGQDDLTLLLQVIVKDAKKLRDTMEAEASKRKTDLESVENDMPDECLKLADAMNAHVAAYFNNDVRGQKQNVQRSGAPLRSINHRLKGKEGRIRGNLMGKRVDFSARSVISPDPLLDLDELGVPEEVALTLTVSEIVNRVNFAALTARVLKGPGRIDGARCIIREDGTIVHLELVEHRDRIRLQHGWVVERYLKDGEWVLFNRQPSLHKMSMMALKVRVMKGQTFRLSVCAVTPFNADFDGDEMNLHSVGGVEGQAELMQLMRLPEHIVSPQSNKPVIGLIQDALLGCYLMSLPNTFLRRDQMMQLIMWIKYPLKELIPLPEPAILKPEPMWTGKQALSMLFPPDLEYTRDPDFVVSKGQLLSGILNKSVMGTASGGLIHVMYIDYGPDAASHFVSDAQRLAAHFLLWRGFSVGITDIIPPAGVKEKVHALTLHAFRYVADVQNAAVSMGMSLTPKTDVEPAVNIALGSVLGRAGQLVQAALPSTNRVGCMVSAGSKGSAINLGQMIALVGQQSVDGQRIHGHPLPSFSVDQVGPNRHGFVKHNYLQGLTPEEFFHHAMGGREGLVDTSVKTALIGYMQRRLMKGMEDLKVEYDCTVRNSGGEIVEFVYGSDGLDAVNLEKVRNSLGFETDEQIKSRCTPTESDRLIKLREELRAGKLTVLCPKMEHDFHLPVNVGRLMANAQARWPKSSSPQFTPEELETLVQQLLESLNRISGDPKKTFYLRCYLSSELTVKRLVDLSREAVEFILISIENRYERSLVNPGEMVGALAAESCGEPATQLTLNSFHTSGCVHDVTLGVPRFKELIDVSRNLKTPSMTLALAGPFGTSFDGAEYVQSTLGSTFLYQLVKETLTLHEPDVLVSAKDQELCSLEAPFIPGDFQEKSPSEYIIRFQLDKAVMIARKIIPADVSKALVGHIGNDKVYVQFSDANMVNWVVRLRYLGPLPLSERLNSNKLQAQKSYMQKLQLTLLNEVRVSGMPDVTSAVVREREYTEIDSDTGGIVTKKHYYVQTRGTNLGQALLHGCIDFSSSWSNDVQEVQNLLGIEAAVSLLFHEINTVLSFDGTYVNPRHMAMVVGTMTHRGYLMPMSRHGLNRINTGALVRSSFEETTEVLSQASVFGEIDHMKGVTENIMTGQLAPLGSGLCSIITPPQPKDPSKSEKPAIVVTTVTDECMEEQWEDEHPDDFSVQNDPDDIQMWDETRPSINPEHHLVFTDGLPYQSFQASGYQGMYDPNLPLMELTQPESESCVPSGATQLGTFIGSYRPNSPVTEEELSMVAEVPYIPRSP